MCFNEKQILATDMIEMVANLVIADQFAKFVNLLISFTQSINDFFAVLYTNLPKAPNRTVQ